MKTFLSATADVLQQVIASTHRFEEHGAALSEAATLIDTSNRRTEEVMADRREALDSVVNQIDSKVGDLDHRLKRFSVLLSETFEAAEGRARDIARVLAESSTEGTKVDLQPVRAGACDHRGGAPPHLRGAATPSTSRRAERPPRCSARPRRSSSRSCGR